MVYLYFFFFFFILLRLGLYCQNVFFSSDALKNDDDNALVSSFKSCLVYLYTTLHPHSCFWWLNVVLFFFFFMLEIVHLSYIMVFCAFSWSIPYFMLCSVLFASNVLVFVPFTKYTWYLFGFLLNDIYMKDLFLYYYIVVYLDWNCWLVCINSYAFWICGPGCLSITDSALGLLPYWVWNFGKGGMHSLKIVKL